jgi:hypothetical protein
MKKLLFATLLLISASAQAATFTDSFDTSTMLNRNVWSSEVSGTGATAPKLIPSPTGGYGYAVSAINSGGARRSELTIKSSQVNAKMLNDVQYTVTFDSFIKQYDTTKPPAWMTFNQYHTVPHMVAGKPIWTCVAGRNPVTLTIQKGSYGVNINTKPALVNPSGALGNYVWTEPFVVNKWVNWKLVIVASQTSKGLIEVYKDGLLVTSFKGRNMDTNDKCGLPLSNYVYFKMGIYKDKTNTATQEIVFDNVKISN